MDPKVLFCPNSVLLNLLSVWTCTWLCHSLRLQHRPDTKVTILHESRRRQRSLLHLIGLDNNCSVSIHISNAQPTVSVLSGRNSIILLKEKTWLDVYQMWHIIWEDMDGWGIEAEWNDKVKIRHNSGSRWITQGYILTYSSLKRGPLTAFCGPCSPPQGQ